MFRRILIPAVITAGIVSLAGCGDSSPDSVLSLAGADRSLAGGSSGPVITLRSNLLPTQVSGEPTEPLDVFAGNGLRFTWSAKPGESGSPVAGFGYAVDDTSEWAPFSLENTEWPPSIKGEPQFWFPDAGPHKFFVRAIDEEQTITVLVAEFVVFLGPQFCSETERFILVVLDTDPVPLVANGIWPADYPDVERALVDSWFEGYDFQLWETGGTAAPPVSLMNCASSTFWIHGSDVGAGAASVLESYHLAGANTLQSYSAAGGNIFLAGIRPSEALRWFESADDGDRIRQEYPVAFDETLGGASWANWVPHWAATRLPLAEVERSVGGGRSDADALPRITVATSAVTGGPNPYPELPWDPARWTGLTRGFGYFDFAVRPEDGEVIYELNATGTSLGVRRLIGPGVRGNAVFVGFHPYFVEDSAFRSLVRAVLIDFGEPTDPER
jgi:hypothetical protein